VIKQAISLISLYFICNQCFSQAAVEPASFKQLRTFEDSLVSLSNKFINSENEQDRKTANDLFIKTLDATLKIKDSFTYPFDSLKSISVQTSPDKHFRIFTWPIANQDSTFHYYGIIQTENLQLLPLNDFSSSIKHPEDSVTSAQKWYGAAYYKIVPVYYPKPYYVLLGWKPNNSKTTKKVIDVLSFNNDNPVFGMAVFEHGGKTKKRIVFEYTRQATMHLNYEQEKKTIVFDHLSPPSPSLKDHPETYGPDLSYDGYHLKIGKWIFADNLDMKNLPDDHDVDYNDPKVLKEQDKATAKKAE
jgi:hypothetical protein